MFLSNLTFILQLANGLQTKSAIGKYGHISWNVSLVTDMREVFRNKVHI